MTDQAQAPGESFIFNTTQPKPDTFRPDEWTIIKDGSDRVAARHNATGVVRKIPKTWLTQ